METVRWIRHIFLGIMIAGTTGSIAYVITIIAGVIKRDLNPYIRLTLMKASILLSLIPVMLPVVYAGRVRYYEGQLFYKGNLMNGSPDNITILMFVVCVVWFTGCIFQVIRITAAWWRLDVVRKGNIPVDNEEWLRIFDGYKEKYALKGITIMQNDLLYSPVTVGIFNPQIILPYKNYDDRHIHMILEHEFHHIRSHDLLWKQIGVLATWIHWINPLMHILFNRLVFQEEVVCDMHVSSGNSNYTQDDYIRFLGGLDDNDLVSSTASAFCEIKHHVLRRIELMLKLKNVKKPTAKAALLSVVTLVAMTFAPSYVMAEQTAGFEENLIDRKAVQIDVDTQSSDDVEVMVGSAINDGVTDIELMPGVMPLSEVINIDMEIEPNTRISWPSRSFSYGDEIRIAISCDKDITYRIGIKNINTLTTWYIEGSGMLAHTFTVPSDGPFCAYVENCSDEYANFSGFAVY